MIYDMKHFTITELCASKTAKKNGIYNEPTAAVADNLVRLVENVLDPLRIAYGKPITVNSGYRSKALNRLVGGVSNSQHLEGKAADIVGTPNTKEENGKLFELIRKLNLPFCQLINESDLTWVHVSYDRNNIKRQVLKL
jgi:cobalamin biosynthesis protein CbiG